MPVKYACQLTKALSAASHAPTIIPTINSYILQQFLPNALLIIYPDANHGAHFQYPDLFLKHARPFLDEQ